METKNITITKDILTEAYKNGDKNVKDTLTHIFGIEMFRPKNIMDRVKTFEDAVNELGKDHPLVIEYRKSALLHGPAILAYAKLRIIVAALNEGWKPKFTKGEKRYYPYFYFYTKKEYDEMSKEWRANLILFGAYADNGASAGVAYALSLGVPSTAFSYIDSRLCFKTRELAAYAGKQFIDIFYDFYRK